jgi:microcystin degradation protein MlrC
MVTLADAVTVGEGGSLALSLGGKSDGLPLDYTARVLKSPMGGSR